MKSQVTTRRGDNGSTQALNGHVYSKTHPIMECVGTLDELRTQLAMARLMLASGSTTTVPHLEETLTWLLHVLFAMGAACSDPLLEKPQWHRVHLGREHLSRLEAAQERLESEVSLPRKFIVGASSLPSAQVDIACAVARRFERTLVRLKEETPGFDADLLIAFANRLSDFLFVAARRLENGNFQIVDYDCI